MRVLGLCAALAACKSRATPPPAASGSDAAVAIARDAAVAPADASGLRLEASEDVGERLAFGDHVPQLPAISADGALVASFESSATGMMMPMPFALRVRPFGTALDIKAETFEIVDDDMATAAADADWQNTPPPAAVQQKLQQRGAAAIQRLQGFTSLTAIELDPAAPSKIDDFTFATSYHDDDLDLALRDAGGAVIKKQRLAAFTMGTYDTGMDGADAKMSCDYRPFIRGAYRSRQALVLWIAYRWHELCSVLPGGFVKWDLPAASPERAAIAAVAAQQLELLEDTDAAAKVFLPDAAVIHTSGTGDVQQRPFRVAENREQYMGHADDAMSITQAADGKSAWTSLTSRLTILPQNQPGRDDPWRISALLVKTAAGWRIFASDWSEPRDNAAVNRAAKAAAAPLPELPATPSDPELSAAFDALITDGLPATGRDDLVAIGSGPNERTVGAAALAAGWNSHWKGHVTVTSRTSRRTPSGTTGYVVANVLLAKPGYRVPFQLFCIFERAGTAWTLVHLHFAA